MSIYFALVLMVLAFSAREGYADENRLQHMAETVNTPSCRDGDGEAPISKVCHSLGNDMYLIQVTLPYRILTFSDSFIDCRSLQRVRLGLSTSHSEREFFEAIARRAATSGPEDAVMQVAKQYSGTAITDVNRENCDKLREAR
ncbi:MAG: hypothetical protein AAF801_15795 [Pseudomonadota bacterium]